MRTQHLFILAFAITACALLGSRAGAEELILDSNAPTLILADLEQANGAPLSAQDFTGGVGSQNGGDAGGVVVQMLQPITGSSGNSPSNYAYVRPVAAAGH